MFWSVLQEVYHAVTNFGQRVPVFSKMWLFCQDTVIYILGISSHFGVKVPESCKRKLAIQV